jgi:hypothetical protein
MRLHFIDYVLWWGEPALMSMIAMAMFRRRLNRDFPYFFNYVVLQILTFVVEFPLRGWTNYYYIYWTFSALSVAVAFAVLLEIFKEAFRPYEALRDLSLILFRWCALVVLLVAGMWAVTSWHPESDGITSAILLVNRCVRVMQCGLVLFLLLFSEYLGISRRNVVFGVSIGFGFYAAVNMLVTTALSHHSLLSKGVLNRINGAAYLATALIWLGYALLPSTVRSGARQPDHASQRWDYALDEARNPPTAVSLLDSMDQTVDRLLYHRSSDVTVVAANRH